MSAYIASFNIITASVVFFAYLIVDALYAKYTIAVGKLESGKAATYGSVMYFLLAIGILNYIHNPLYLFPLALGSWVGTYVTVEMDRKKKLEVSRIDANDSL